MGKRQKKTPKTVAVILTLVIALLGGLCFSCAATTEEEFRGVWVASVFTLHYPSKTSTDAESLKRDAVAVLDNAKAMGFNAVFFQVRPTTDALYKSDLFPWSKYLTGTEGVAPSNGFDPLEFMVEEAHKRDMELHAWINPYRITAKAGDEAYMSAENPAIKYPQLTVKHAKDGKLYWNPGEPEAINYIVDGVTEIVENYDVDGIQFDDYFYPDSSFEDAETFAKYGEGFSSIADWRRDNTRRLIKNTYEAVHRSGKDIEFGVSPMGVWASKSTNPLGSDTQKCAEAYTKSFADTRGWVKDEIVDYIIPQIYWEIGSPNTDYKGLTEWWSSVVRGTNVKLYIGQAAYRTGNTDASSPWYGVDQIRRQVELNRNTSGVSGYSMYAYSSFTQSPALTALIKELNADSLPPVSGGTDSGQEPEDQEQQGVFKDLNGHWAKDSIEAMAEKGIIKGDTEGNAMPNSPIKRADFVLMLLRMLGVEANDGQSLSDNFADVASDMYYAKELAKAKELGLISGVGDDRFAPESPVTRQDMFTMTYRALGQMNKLSGTASESLIDGFKDAADVREYARTPMAYLIEKKAVNGMDDGSLLPEKTATRAETATFLYKLM